MTQTVAPGILSDSPRAKTLRRLRECVVEGQLPPGERLPAEQKLARQFSVSRGTVRAALAMLAEEGLIERRPNCGYRVAARSAPRSSLMAKTVALLTSLDEEPRRGLFTGKMAAVESGIADEVGRAGLNLLAIQTGRFDTRGVDGLIADRPAGLVVNCPTAELGVREGVLARLARAKVRLVVHSGAEAFDPYDRVTSDHEGGGHALTKHLISAGRRRILRLWSVPAGAYWIAGHDAGHERALREAGIEAIRPVHLKDLPERVTDCRETFEARARHMAGHLVEHLRAPAGVDAIMVSTDCEVFCAAAACRLFGLDPSRDVVITGYDNYWQDAFERQWEKAVPSGTIDKSNHRVGEELVRLLLDRVEGQLDDEPQQRIVPQRLVVPEPAQRRA